MKKLILILSIIVLIYACGKDSEAATPPSNPTDNTSNNTEVPAEEVSTSNSNSVINQNFECGNGYYYLSRPEPSEIDDTHEYFEYGWQSSPPVCVNVYQSELLEGRDEKLKISMDWLKSNLQNIIPINVFYIDQFNASEESKLQHDTDFCNLVGEPSELDDCIAGI